MGILFLNKKKEFEFIIPQLKLYRNDNLELREKVLNMTSINIDKILWKLLSIL